MEAGAPWETTFCSKATHGSFDKLLLAVKIGFVILLVVLSAIVPHYPDMKAAIDHFPKKHPGLFAGETLLLAVSGGLAMFLIGLLKGKHWDDSSLLFITGASFVVVGLLHVLQQYSGLYTYSYEKPTPKMENRYIILAAIGCLVLILLGVCVAAVGACIRQAQPDSHAITFLCAFMFGVVFSVPYLYVAYNRDHREVKEAKSYYELVTNLVLFMLIYVFIHTTGFWQSLYASS